MFLSIYGRFDLRQYLQDNKLVYRARKKSQVYIEDMAVHEAILFSVRFWDIIATKGSS